MTSWHDLNPAGRMAAMREELIISAPFFGALFASQELVARESIGTAAVNGKALAYAPSFVAGLPELQCLGMGVHETLHLALMHHVRRGEREPELWNKACDLELNPMVLASGFVLPDGALIEARFAGMSAESIYAQLAAESGGPAGAGQDRQQDGQEAPGSAPDDSGPGDSGPDGEGTPAPDPGQCGAVLDAADSAEGLAEARAEAEAMVRQALSVARAANGGSIPDALAPLVSTLNRAPIDWRAETAEFIDDAASKAVSWNTPNRRFLQSGFILPGSMPDAVGCIALAVDCSGSIGRETLAQFQGLAQQLLDDGRVERLAVVYCHAKVCGSAEFLAGDSIELKIEETGGTAFAPALAHVEAHWPEAVAIVYLTDLEAYSAEAWGAAPSVPVLWAVQGERRRAPFGRVLPIDAHS